MRALAALAAPLAAALFSAIAAQAHPLENDVLFRDVLVRSLDPITDTAYPQLAREIFGQIKGAHRAPESTKRGRIVYTTNNYVTDVFLINEINFGTEIAMRPVRWNNDSLIVRDFFLWEDSVSEFNDLKNLAIVFTDLKLIILKSLVEVSASEAPYYARRWDAPVVAERHLDGERCVSSISDGEVAGRNDIHGYPRTLLRDKELSSNLVGFNSSIADVSSDSERPPRVSGLLYSTKPSDNPKPNSGKGEDAGEGCDRIIDRSYPKGFAIWLLSWSVAGGLVLGLSLSLWESCRERNDD